MPSDERVGYVKNILENLRHPERLDNHPWAKGCIVQAAIDADRSLESKSQGTRLVSAVNNLFKELMPGSPPRRGKRLDTRWGEFGILAAQYFGPAIFGTPEPSSLREAWDKIDQVILLFVFGKRAEECTSEEINSYKLIGDEIGGAPYSTISDWHLNGLKRLANLIEIREQHLAKNAEVGQNSEQDIVDISNPIEILPSIRSKKNWRSWILLLFLLILSVSVIYKAWSIYSLADLVRSDITQAQALLTQKVELKTATDARDLIFKIHSDTSRLRMEAEPILQSIGPWLAWIPVYGPDIAVSGDLLAMADELSTATYICDQALTPLLDILINNPDSFSPGQVGDLLFQAQPQLMEAQRQLDLAISTRAGIKVETLSPKTQEIVKKSDLLTRLLQDGLVAGIALPQLLGTSSEGPKTYMLLAQNEDELRATGGLITLVGSFVIENGQVFGLEFQDSALFEDWSKPYPSAPWQMQDFMNIPVMLLRDANWFTDYPTTVARVEYLYAYTNKHSVDGVIAVDQQAIVILLDALGPVTLQGIPEEISAENVIAFMRESKTPPPGTDLRTWDRKAIISKLASALLERLTSGKQVDWQKLAAAIQKALNQKHILLQFDSPDVKNLLARLGWDGAVRAGTGDFLMSIDTNVGYDKTNAVVQNKLAYDVYLDDLSNPTSSLAVFHENLARPEALCNPAIPKKDSPEYWYLTDRCHHNYMRIYVPKGTSLIKATPQFIPAEWMPLGIAIPARVDALDEKIDGVQVFGTLMVVPGGKTVNTSFQFSLPPSVITKAGNKYTYMLRIQKQPGTQAIPITVRIHLPTGARIDSMSEGATATGSDILIDTKLTTDAMITVVFSPN